MFARKIVASVFTLALLCFTGCTAGQGETLSAKELRLHDDIVLALRFSPEAYELTSSNKSGYIVLVKADGSFQAADIGPMDDAQMHWDSNGLYFGGANEEYRVTSSESNIFARSEYEDMETQRIVMSEGKGFLAVYNIGYVDESDFSKGYTMKVVANESGKQSEWIVPGYYSSQIAQCENKIVGLTSYKYLPEEERKTVDGNQSTDVLVQLYPRVNDYAKSILAVVDNNPNIDNSAVNITAAPCVNGKVYLIADRVSVNDENAYVSNGGVLRIFDINSGEYKAIPLTNADPNAKQLGVEELVVRAGQLTSDNKSYIWVSNYDWKVRSVDLQTGVVSEMFKVEVTEPGVPSRVVMTEKSLFVLDEVSNSKPFKLARYDLSNGKKTDLFEIRNLHTINRRAMSINGLQAMALNPAWVEEQERD